MNDYQFFFPLPAQSTYQAENKWPGCIARLCRSGSLEEWTLHSYNSEAAFVAKDSSILKIGFQVAQKRFLNRIPSLV